MDIQNIYNKYLDARTTLEEECWLYEALRTDCPPELLEKRDILLAMLPKPEPALPEGFIARLEKGLQATGHQKKNTRIVLMRWIAGFSAAAILAGIFLLIDGTNSKQTEMSGNETAKVETTTPGQQKEQQVSKVSDNNTSIAPVASHSKTFAKTSPENPSMAQHHARTLQLTPGFSEAEVHTAEAEAELLIAKTEENAEQCIEKVNREALIETTEARMASYIADVEASLSLDIEAAEERIRTTDFNAQLIAQN